MGREGVVLGSRSRQAEDRRTPEEPSTWGKQHRQWSSAPADSGAVLLQTDNPVATGVPQCSGGKGRALGTHEVNPAIEFQVPMIFFTQAED